MLAEFIKTLDYSKHKCVWLLGDNINADILFAECDYEYTANVDTIENYDLFDENLTLGLKCVLTKEMLKGYGKFLETSDRAFWSKSLLIKSQISPDQLDLSRKKGDYVVVFDKLSAAETRALIDSFMRQYANRYNFAFDDAQLAFVKTKVQNLHELIVCSLLKSAGLELSIWQDFVFQEEVSWYKKMKENTLLLEGLTNGMMPVMQYMLRAGFNHSPSGLVRAGILNYLAAAIKDGEQIYEHSELWKKLV